MRSRLAKAFSRAKPENSRAYPWAGLRYPAQGRPGGRPPQRPTRGVLSEGQPPHTPGQAAGPSTGATQKKRRFFQTSLLESGSDLISRAVSSQVPSALRGLTSVFGMGTGGTLLPSPPEIVCTFISHTLKTAHSRFLQSGLLSPVSTSLVSLVSA